MILTAAEPIADHHWSYGAPSIRAVCLDVDETLVDYLSSLRAGLRELVGTDEAWSDWYATTERHYPRFIAGEIDYDTMRRQRTKDFLAARGEILDDQEIVEREERRLAAMRGAWRLFDDALPCLRALRAAGLRVAAVTNAHGQYQRAKLDAVGLHSEFDVVVISGELGVAKPNPSIFLAACHALGSDPAQTVHVGDRFEQDALAANRAGLHGVWLNRSGAPRDDHHGVHVISGLAELPVLIDWLGRE